MPVSNPLVVLHNFAARAGEANKSGTTKSRIQASSMRAKFKSETIPDKIVAATPVALTATDFIAAITFVAPASNGPTTWINAAHAEFWTKVEMAATNFPVLSIADPTAAVSKKII